MKKKLVEMAKAPSIYVPILLEKLYLFWHAEEISNNIDIYRFKRHSILLDNLLGNRIIALPFGIDALLESATVFQPDGALPLWVVLLFKGTQKWLKLPEPKRCASLLRP